MKDSGGTGAIRCAYLSTMRVRVGFVGGLLVAALAGCAGGAGQPAVAGAPAASAVPAVPGDGASASTVAVPATLTFTGTTVDGKPFQAAALAGRPVVLWFWAPWCATCAGEAPSVADANAKYAGKVSIVGIAGLGDLKAMKQFVADLDVGAVPHVNDAAGTIWRKFEITQQSVYVFIDAGGTVVHRGWLDSVAFDERLAALARR